MKPYYQRAGWRWMPGMRWGVVRSPPLEPVIGRVGDLALIPYPGAVPDLDDPATQGAALAVLREVTRSSAVYAASWPAFAGPSLFDTVTKWAVFVPQANGVFSDRMPEAATLAEALHAALDRLIPE